MIRRVILSGRNYFQLALVMIGAFAGLFLIMASVQLYLDFKNLMVNKEDLIAPQFLVINKPVSIVNTLAGPGKGFDAEDIDAIKQIKSVEAVGGFTANRFEAKAAFEFGGNAVYTDIFFESVPDGFIDIKPDGWNWGIGHEVPVVLPADYINLYNFGFAPGHNLPQISKGVAEMAPIQLKIYDRAQNVVTLPGRIAGFSNRINSILVPETFLNYANKTYGDGVVKNPNRLVIKCKDPADAELTAFLEAHHYETNSEMMKNSRFLAMLKLLLTIMLCIGGIIILLSITGFVQHTQLLITQSAYEVRTLLQLGYFVKTVFAKIMGFYLMLMAVIYLLGALAVYAGKIVFNDWLTAKGIVLEEGVSGVSLLTGAGLIAVIAFLNAVNLYRLIYRKALPSK